MVLLSVVVLKTPACIRVRDPSANLVQLFTHLLSVELMVTVTPPRYQHTQWLKIEHTQGHFNHSYLSSVSVAQCKLDYQACITGKKIAVRCPGTCPCPAQLQTSSTEKTGSYFYLWLHFTDEIQQFHTGDLISTLFFCSLVCSELDLKEVVSRLKDWFRVLHENGNHKRVKKPEKNSESFSDGTSQALITIVTIITFNDLTFISRYKMDLSTVMVYIAI